MGEDKYWIKSGMSVGHVDHEDIKVYVDKVLKSKDKEGRSYTKGVLCHWLDGDGKYCTGVFHTKELKPLEQD